MIGYPVTVRLPFRVLDDRPWLQRTGPRSGVGHKPSPDSMIARGSSALARGGGPDVGNWHIADDVLAALKVRYRVSSSAAIYFDECPESRHLSACRSLRQRPANRIHNGRSPSATGRRHHFGVGPTTPPARPATRRVSSITTAALI
jgi:hypothetical protein